MNTKSLILVTTFCWVVVVSSGGNNNTTCHEGPGARAIDYLATKSPYKFSAAAGDDDDDNDLEQCEAVKLWYFGRHGTRWPGDDDVVLMKNVLPHLFDEIVGSIDASNLCPTTSSHFKTWNPRPDLNITTSSFLHPQGHYEVSRISSNHISRYTTLFPPTYSNSSYYFRFTNAQRTNASAHAFVSSIFKDPSTVWFPQPLNKDPVLKFYSSCPKWEEQVDKNPDAVVELHKFERSSHMNRTIQRVSKTLGLKRNLTLDEISLMYTTCAFETAWDNGTLSQWCSGFGIEDLSVMEYREDLEYYWKDGYGFQVNYEQACVAFNDTIRFFDEYPGEQHLAELEYKKVQAYFSHSGATLKMFARLGLFNDSLPLLSDNYEQVKNSYQWRTGSIDRMGTNMAFVMYRCSNNNKPITDRLKIRLFVQERPTPFPGCGGNNHTCSYEEFRGNMIKFTQDCDLEKICRL